MYVIKRDGTQVPFNHEKIINAIDRAFIEVDGQLYENDTSFEIALEIAKTVERAPYRMTVEEIQDLVENELMKSSRKEVAKAYIKYRNARNIARKAKTRDIFLEIINIKNNDVTRENANMNADTPAGMMMKFSSETT